MTSLGSTYLIVTVILSLMSVDGQLNGKIKNGSKCKTADGEEGLRNADGVCERCQAGYFFDMTKYRCQPCGEHATTCKPNIATVCYDNCNATPYPSPINPATADSKSSFSSTTTSGEETPIQSTVATTITITGPTFQSSIINVGAPSNTLQGVSHSTVEPTAGQDRNCGLPAWAVFLIILSTIIAVIAILFFWKKFPDKWNVALDFVVKVCRVQTNAAPQPTSPVNSDLERRSTMLTGDTPVNPNDTSPGQGLLDNDSDEDENPSSPG